MRLVEVEPLVSVKILQSSPYMFTMERVRSYNRTRPQHRGPVSQNRGVAGQRSSAAASHPPAGDRVR